jgi:hypothetical protein
VDAPALAAALSQLRDAPDGALRGMAVIDRETKSRNFRTAIVLWSIVAVFFIAIVLKYWMLR